MSNYNRKNTDVNTGWLKGHAIRRARKSGRCEYGRCKNQINQGDYYVSGEHDGSAGGFGQARYCLDCVPEAILTTTEPRKW